MYNIVNYDRWWKYEKSFSDFTTAFMMYELLGDENNIIEHINMNTNEKECVWDKSFERRENGTIHCECSNRIN